MMNPFLDLHKIKEMLVKAQFSWFVCGGWAIDLYLGTVTREHKDVDIAIWRKDQLLLQQYLTERGWTIDVAGGGKLIPWAAGDFIELPKHNVWCTNEKHNPDFLEVLFNEEDGESFLFRKDFSIKRPLSQTIRQSNLGISYLAPEIVLLYKSRHHDELQNQADFAAVSPLLSDESRVWLKNSITMMNQEHPWLANLS